MLRADVGRLLCPGRELAEGNEGGWGSLTRQTLGLLAPAEAVPAPLDDVGPVEAPLGSEPGSGRLGGSCGVSAIHDADRHDGDALSTPPSRPGVPVSTPVLACSPAPPSTAEPLLLPLLLRVGVVAVDSDARLAVAL